MEEDKVTISTFFKRETKKKNKTFLLAKKTLHIFKFCLKEEKCRGKSARGSDNGEPLPGANPIIIRVFCETHHISTALVDLSLN